MVKGGKVMTSSAVKVGRGLMGFCSSSNPFPRFWAPDTYYLPPWRETQKVLNWNAHESHLKTSIGPPMSRDMQVPNLVEGLDVNFTKENHWHHKLQPKGQIWSFQFL